ncbi:MAG TPA: substrate-binding domain-containing protein [Geminicoccaceae bacterium]|nr:substrate-binding domain-containing protein [Geminicoccaceae bacterium]
MSTTGRTLVAATAAALLALATGAASAPAKGPTGRGMTIYMQMGGSPGAGSTLPRANGARDAARRLGAELIEQYAAWQPQRMVDQLREALAAGPDCIVVMGHPGAAALAEPVAEAVRRGIVVTSTGAPVGELLNRYRHLGFGYAGPDPYAGGHLVGRSMVAAGLKAGDRALVYGLLAEAERGVAARGLKDALEEAGVETDYLEIGPEVDADGALALPVLTSYLRNNPDVRAIGTQHGDVTAVIPQALRAAGRRPGDVIVGGVDLAPATALGLREGYVTVVLDQQPYAQGYLPVLQCVLTGAYGFGGLTVDTAAGPVTPETVGALLPLIGKGIR